MRLTRSFVFACAIVGLVAADASAQSPLTWNDVRTKFEAVNPTLLADQTGVEESRAAEVTAFLRPNPLFSFTFDQVGNNEGPNAFTNAVHQNMLASQAYTRMKQQETGENAAAMLASVNYWLRLLGALLFVVQFFRDPARVVPQQPNAVLAPAEPSRPGTALIAESQASRA